MKNLIFLAAFLMASNLFAQKGVMFMLDFTPGVSMGLNNEDFDRGRDLDLNAAFGWNLGFKVGYSFNDKLSLVTGLGFASHTAAFVHERDQIDLGILGSIDDPNHNKKFSRTLGYVRIPLLLQIGGSSGDEGGGFFFRFGPTFNFLTGAVYKDQRFDGFSKYDENKGINLHKKTDVWTSNDAGKTAKRESDPNSPTGYKQAAIYNDFVLGFSMDIGGQIRLADNFKMIITLNLETTLSNPEGLGASSYAHNISNDVMGTVSDLGKSISEQTPFDATYPNYVNSNNSNLSKRTGIFNVFGGLTIGFAYTIPVN